MQISHWGGSCGTFGNLVRPGIQQNSLLQLQQEKEQQQPNSQGQAAAAGWQQRQQQAAALGLPCDVVTWRRRRQLQRKMTGSKWTPACFALVMNVWPCEIADGAPVGRADWQIA